MTEDRIYKLKPHKVLSPVVTIYTEAEIQARSPNEHMEGWKYILIKYDDGVIRLSELFVVRDRDDSFVFAYSPAFVDAVSEEHWDKMHAEEGHCEDDCGPDHNGGKAETWRNLVHDIFEIREEEDENLG